MVLNSSKFSRKIEAQTEGGVVGVLWVSMIFRAAPVKSEAKFVQQNRKLVHKCGFRFYWHGAEHDEIFDQKRAIEVVGARFEVSRSLFCMFRGAPQKSESTFVNQLSILFHKWGLRFYWQSSENHPTT